ncbi:MAG: cyclophilin-like fold protein [Candidatus Mucispirillum faecigallinarum]|nr:cyclophilin-like fold protein [Candidatus Mucispirillum faecigallinarum]
MNKFLLFILICFIIPINTACADNAGSSKEVNLSHDNNSAGAESMENINITLDINGKIFNAVFYNNETAQKFAEMLPVTMNMTELNGNEKYYYLNTTLPVNSERVDTIKKGDIMLYGNNCIVIFYESFNTSYSYTKIGYIENPDNIKDALGSGSVNVTFKK